MVSVGSLCIGDIMTLAPTLTRDSQFCASGVPICFHFLAYSEVDDSELTGRSAPNAPTPCRIEHGPHPSPRIEKPQV